VVPYARAVFPARVAEVLLAIFAYAVFQTLYSVAAVLSFASGCDVLALVVVNVAPDFEVEVCFAGGAGYAVSADVGLTRGDGAVGCGLESLQAARGVCCDTEVAGEGWADVGGSGVRVDLDSASVEHVRQCSQTDAPDS